MSYMLHVVGLDVPANDEDVFPFLAEIAGASEDVPLSQRVQQFCDAALKLFPCLSSYDRSDQRIEECPWADGPLANNFQGEYGSLAIVRRHGEVIPRLLRIASDLGLTVVDEQQGTVHRPPLFQVVLEGPVDGVDPVDAASRLAGLMHQPVAPLAALMHERRRVLIKKGLSREDGEKYVYLLAQRASCKAVLMPEGRKSAPAPTSTPAPVMAPLFAPAFDGGQPEAKRLKPALLAILAVGALAAGWLLLRR